MIVSFVDVFKASGNWMSELAVISREHFGGICFIKTIHSCLYGRNLSNLDYELEICYVKIMITSPVLAQLVRP